MLSTPVSLLERLRKPHEVAAWDRFVELYSPLLFHWAKRLGQQDSDAADLVQDVFLLLWRNLANFQYDRSKSFHAWLKTMFLNRARQRFRERVPAGGDDAIANLPDPANAADLIEEREYRQYLLHQALRLIQSEFSATHVQAFREHVIAGRGADDVARALGMRVGAVYCIKSRMLNRLRQELAHLVD